MNNIDGINFRIVTDIEEAKRLWSKLCTIETIYDDWDFLYLFYKTLKFPLQFITAFSNDNEPIGLLPLQNNETEGYLEFFGGNFMEYNKVFILPEYANLIPEFFMLIEGKYKLRSMIGGEFYPEELENDDFTYFLNLENIKCFEDYLFLCHKKSKSRNHYRRIVRKVNSSNISIRKDHYDDLKYLIEFNSKRFPEDSHFLDSNITEAFYGLLESKFEVHMVSILIDDIVESVGVSVFFGNTFYCELTGTNRDSIADLGTYTTVQKLKLAIELGAKVFDVGHGDCNWKERWHLEKVLQYKLTNINE